jgi:anti-sigma factor RsiW
MNCSDIHELAPLYVCGELEPARAAEFDAHLKSCSSCLQELEEQSRLDARLRQALLAEGVDVQRVNRRIRELMTAESIQPTVIPAPRRSMRGIVVAAGIAAAFLLAAGVYLMAPGRFSKVYADAAEDHQSEVIEHSPRRWYVEPDQIVKFEQYLGISLNVPQELAGGYRLERGKICQLDGKLYLHLVYTDGTREFSLFLRPRDGERLTGTVRGIANGRLLHASVSGDERLSSFATSHLIAIVATNQDVATSISDARQASNAIQD